jgi:hypothetical protein
MYAAHRNLRDAAKCSYWLDRNYAFEMGRNFEDFGIERPIVEVSHGAFEEGRHACVAGLNVPVMARVVRIWPRYSDQAHEMTDWKILRMLVQ